MPLTYRPFADTPEVDRLSHDLRMNVPDGERFATGLLGAALAAAAFSRHGLSRWALLIAGGALFRRALTGHCDLYASLDIDRRHDYLPQRERPTSGGHRVEAAVEIDCPAETLFRFWRNLEQLPRVMRHVRSVKELDQRRSHWTVAGPLGKAVEWDAEIINEQEGRMIAWQSLPGSHISSAGSVWFEAVDQTRTRVKVAFEYNPPAGELGALVSSLLGASPERELRDDLARFKTYAEGELQSLPAYERREDVRSTGLHTE